MSTDKDNIFSTDGKKPVDKQEPVIQPTDTLTSGGSVPDSVQALVGEGKKYANVDEALKSIVPAQEHIQNLEREQQELREDLSKRLSAEDILKEIKSHSSVAGDTTSTVLDEETIARVASSVVDQRETERLTTSNLLAVDKAMKQKFGDKAQDIFVSRCTELGITPEDAQKTAEKSPSAFLTLMGLTTELPTSSKLDTMTSSINTEALQTQGTNVVKGSQLFYRKLRRENSAEYYKPATQIAMQAYAKRLGAAFFNK